MLSEVFYIDWALFIHLAGIIIALGSVTVIDSMGFISRKNKKWTQTTISAHHITKPLIWIGIALIIFSWFFILISEGFTNINSVKSVILVILIVNGLFLSFYISSELDKLKGKNILLPTRLQKKIALSMLVSFFSWWIFVLLTIAKLS